MVQIKLPRAIPIFLFLLVFTGKIGTAVAGPIYTFATIDVPGATETHVYGINSIGILVGTYFTSQTSRHGFIGNPGAFSTLDVPGAERTNGMGINDAGAVVGYYYAANRNHGFLYDGTGYTTIDAPGAITSLFDVNNVGLMSGLAQGVHNAGVLTDGVTFTSVAVALETAVYGTNDLGAVLGAYSTTGNPWRGFVISGGVSTPIDFPGCAETIPYGISNLGVISGYTCSGGFVLENGVYSPLTVPGAIWTAAYGINDLGQIVGEYGSPGGGVHGFVATPVPEPASLLLLGTGLVGLRAWKKRRA